jgi:Holliday junction resolvasome RuvABC DNA-binding subunit
MKKSSAVLNRLFRNITEHMSRHPNDKAPYSHLKKLGFSESQVRDAIKQHLEQE